MTKNDSNDRGPSSKPRSRDDERRSTKPTALDKVNFHKREREGMLETMLVGELENDSDDPNDVREK